MFLTIPDNLIWLEPWKKDIGRSDDGMVQELRKELGPHHVLYGVEVLPVGHRVDCDDVLFATNDPSKPLAVVHLTFAQHPEPDPRWPDTEVFQGWQDWINRCMIPENLYYSGDYLFAVKDSFMIAERGLVIAGASTGTERSPFFRVGAPPMLLRPGMPPLASKIKGLEMFSPPSEELVAILLEGNLEKSDVPIETQVWLVDARARY